MNLRYLVCLVCHTEGPHRKLTCYWRGWKLYRATGMLPSERWLYSLADSLPPDQVLQIYSKRRTLKDIFFPFKWQREYSERIPRRE